MPLLAKVRNLWLQQVGASMKSGGEEAGRRGGEEWEGWTLGRKEEKEDKERRREWQYIYNVLR